MRMKNSILYTLNEMKKRYSDGAFIVQTVTIIICFKIYGNWDYTLSTTHAKICIYYFLCSEKTPFPSP